MTMTREDSLLVLNLGSVTLKAARFERFRPGMESVVPSQCVETVIYGTRSAPEDALALAVEALGLAAPPAWVGHRVVHGGDAATARILDAREMDRLRALAGLAPQHQPPALALIDAASKRWPHAVQCGVYDTAWHATLPADVRRLPVPRDWDAMGIRRFGFHGLAFASAMRRLAGFEPGIARSRVVLAHLGGGSSLCAVHDGRSVDTTMAMTPLGGIPMATRSGSLDPGALLFLLRNGFTVDALEQALYHECGMRGISGCQGDVRGLLASKTAEATLALDMFAFGVAQGIAGMAMRMGGFDDLAFSGGIGANAAGVRAAIARHLAWLGLALDEDANISEAIRLDTRSSRIRIWRVEVDEAIEIATACAAACEGATRPSRRPARRVR